MSASTHRPSLDSASFAITSFSASPTIAPSVVVTTWTSYVPQDSSTDASNQPSNTSNGLADSGALYLYTFLATLVLLLSISCAIVIRSLIIRRRRSRIIAESIANGTWIQPTPGSLRDIGTKPALYEAFVRDVKGSAANKGNPEELDWDAIMPFAASYVSTQSVEHVMPDASAPTPETAPSRIARLVTPWRRPNRDNSPLPLPVTAAITPEIPLTTTLAPSTTESPSPSAKSSLEPSALRVAVLIAMPTPPQLPHVHRSSSSDDEDEEIPLVEFGVAEIEVGGQGMDGDK